MYWHLAEFVAEARFHEGTRSMVQRLPWRAQHVVHGSRSDFIVPGSKFRVGGFAQRFFLATFFALATRAKRAAAGALALQEERRNMVKFRFSPTLNPNLY